MTRDKCSVGSAASCDRSGDGTPDVFCLDKPTRYWFGFRATDKVDDALQILEGATGTLERFTANNEDMPDTFVQSVRAAIQQATEDLAGHRTELERNAKGVFERFLITDEHRNYADPIDYVIPLLRRCSLHELHCMGDELRIRFEREEREFKRSLAASDDADESNATPTDDQPSTIESAASEPMVAGKPAEPTPAVDPAPAESTDDQPSDCAALDRLMPLLRRCSPAYHEGLAGELTKHLKDWGERFANTTEHFEKPSSPDSIQPATPAALDNEEAADAEHIDRERAGNQAYVKRVQAKLPNMDPTPRRCINIHMHEADSGGSVPFGESIVDQSVWVTESEATDLAASVGSAVAEYPNMSRVDGR